MKNTKRNLVEIGKDFKGIGISILTTGASLVSLVADTVKIPVSICKDTRNFIVSKKESKVIENTETTEVKNEVTEEIVVKETPVKKPRVKKVIQNAEDVAVQS